MSNLIPSSTSGTTPWLVSLKDSHYADPVHFCGGTVISHAWVLTSASCVAGYSYPYTYLQVRLACLILTFRGPFR